MEKYEKYARVVALFGDVAMKYELLHILSDSAEQKELLRSKL